MKGTRAGLFVLMVSLALALFAGQANAAPSSAVYVADYGANQVVVVNLDSYTHKEISVPTPYGISITTTPDGKKKAYTANKDNKTCSVLDLSDPSNIKVIATIPVGAGAQHVAITPDGTKAYVANTKDNFISILDTVNDTSEGTIDLGGISYTTVSPNGQKLYATFYEDPGFVSRVNLGTGWSEGDRTLSPLLTCAVVGPDLNSDANVEERRLYVSSQSQVCIYNLNADYWDDPYYDMGAIPNACGLRMLFNGNGSKLYVANCPTDPNEPGGCLQIVGLDSFGNWNKITPITIGLNRPVGLALTPDETQLLVSSEWDGKVYVIGLDYQGNPTTSPVELPVDFSKPAELAIGPRVPEPPQPPPSELTILIDIKPGSFPNSINPKSQGRIPVAILSGGDVHPGMVKIESLKFGRDGNESSFSFANPVAQDLNGDGIADLICHFWTQKTGFLPGDKIGILTGETLEDSPFKGTDSVRIVPAK